MELAIFTGVSAVTVGTKNGRKAILVRTSVLLEAESVLRAESPLGKYVQCRPLALFLVSSLKAPQLRMTRALATGYATHMDRDEIMRVLRAFESAGLEYVLIGAAAMGFHGLVRVTEDLDLFIRATAENVEKLRAAFRAVYEGDPHINDISAADLLGEYPSVRYVPPSGDLYFDVMTRLGDVASFESIEAEVKEEDGTHIRVATPAALYRLKKGTIRKQDHVDAAALRERFDLKEEG